MSGTSNDNIMGFIPKDQYVKYTYYLLLVSAGGALVLSLLGILGLSIPLTQLFTLAGLAGLVLALLGYFIYKTDYSEHDQSHLLYICIVFALFFIGGLILASSFVLLPTLWNVVSFAIGLAQLLVVYTGYNSWKQGRTITKSNFQNEIKLALKRG